MIKLITVTGFLGSGKTTLVDSLLKSFEKEKIGVIINDFGQVNVDAEIIRKDGIEMAELSNGSIFCACIKDKFVESLVELSKKDIDYLVIEASGLADPSNMPGILEGLESVLERKYSFEHSICVVDCVSFLELSEVLVALSRQIDFADIIVMNKCDLCDDDTINEIENAIAEKKSGDKYILEKTSYCSLDFEELIKSESNLNGISKDTVNTRDNRPLSIVLKQRGALSEGELNAFLSEMAKCSYRMKGFIECEDGLKKISCVSKQIEISAWDKSEEKALVIISSVGIELISRVVSCAEEYTKGKLYL